MPCLDPNVIQSFVDGVLDADGIIAVQAHLTACDACAGLVAALVPDAPHTHAKKIDRYEITERLGEGGMGVVYAGYDPELHREIALKLLRPFLGTESELGAARGRLLREAQAMARVAHPNVVTVYDVGEWDHHVFVTMELVPKGTLRDWQAAPDRSPREILAAYLEAGRGLAAAHAAGLTHRDFKPDNVLVGADGRMRVTDFGLVRATPTDKGSATSGMLGLSLTFAGTLVGTPAYMAPEQIDGDPTDARCDQFAFCTALWEALYGARPFAGKNLVDLRDAIERHAITPPPKGRRTRAGVHRALERGLAAKPADRWPTMDALLAEITPRRSAALAIAFATTAVVVVALAAVLLTRPAATTCTPIELASSVWHDRSAVLAPKIGADATKRVERYIGQWTAAADDVCKVDRDDAVLRARRERCLVASADSLDALVTHWQAGMDTAALPTHEAIENLPLPTHCSHAMQRDVADPSPAQIPQIRLLGLQLAAATDVAHLTPIFANARATGFAPLVADAALALSSLQAKTKMADAEATVRDALTVVDRDPAALPKILLRNQLVQILGANHADEVGKLVETARALITKLGGDIELEANLDYSVASTLRSRAHSGEAVAAYERARRGFVLAYGPDSRHECEALVNLAGAHAQRNANGKDVIAARDAAIAINDHNGINIPELELLGAIGSDPEVLIKATEKLLARAQSEPPETIVSAEITLATANLLGDHDEKSVELFEKALAHADALHLHDDQVNEAFARLATQLVKVGRAKEALVPARRAVEMALEDKDDATYASANVALGTVLLATDDPRGARAALETALGVFEKDHAPPESRARTRFLLAKATWPIDRAKAIDLAHAARADTQAFLDSIAKDDPAGELYRTRQTAHLADIDAWLAKHH